MTEETKRDPLVATEAEFRAAFDDVNPDPHWPMKVLTARRNHVEAAMAGRGEEDRCYAQDRLGNSYASGPEIVAEVTGVPIPRKLTRAERAFLRLTSGAQPGDVDDLQSPPTDRRRQIAAGWDRAIDRVNAQIGK